MWLPKTKSGTSIPCWKADPFEAKRSILAKSYSILHGDHGCGFSLDGLLELCTPPTGFHAWDIYIYLSIVGRDVGKSIRHCLNSSPS